jgi:hypothetical protein
MDVAANTVQDVEELTPPPRRPVAKRRRHNCTKPKIVTRYDLDGRSNAAHVFDSITTAVHADLGGKEELSAVELRLVEAFAGVSVMTEALNVQLLLGQAVDHNALCQLASTMCRIGSRLGLRRRPKAVEDISLTEYLRERDAGIPEVRDPEDEVL